MWLEYHQPIVANLVHEALLNVCQKHVPCDGKLEIDGIVCISNGNIDKQIVVKIHEVIQQKGRSSPDENANSSAPPKKSPILSIPGYKPRSDASDEEKRLIVTPRSRPIDLTSSREVEPEKKMSISLLKLLSGEEKIQPDPEDDVISPSGSRASSPSALSEDGSKTPICKICNIIMSSVTELVSHTLNEHKRYLCKRCFNSFSLRCNLHRHERLHSGIKPFPCQLCEKSFARNADLKLHLQKHVDVSCAQCNKSFDDSNSLNYHMLKVHHMQDNLHACTICEKAFSSEQQYNKHWETHTDSLANHGQIEVIQRPVGSEAEDSQTSVDLAKEVETRRRKQAKPMFKSLLQPKLMPLPFSENSHEAEDNPSNNNFLETSQDEEAPLDLEDLRKEFGPLFHMDMGPANGSVSRGSSPALSDTSVAKKKRKSIPIKHIIDNGDDVPAAKKMMSGGGLMVKGEPKEEQEEPLALMDTASLSNAVEQVLKNVESPRVSTPKPIKKEGKAFNSPSAEALADDEVTYTCRYGGCGTKSFGFKAHEEHFFCVHGRFPCKLCDQSFTCKNNRTRHIRNHLGIAKRHTCDRCHKTFTRPDILQEHKMIHTLSYKTDRCNGCGATFDRKALLLTHMKKCFRNRGDLLEKDMTSGQMKDIADGKLKDRADGQLV